MFGVVLGKVYTGERKCRQVLAHACWTKLATSFVGGLARIALDAAVVPTCLTVSILPS